jgi:hypothetical protein
VVGGVAHQGFEVRDLLGAHVPPRREIMSHQEASRLGGRGRKAIRNMKALAVTHTIALWLGGGGTGNVHCLKTAIGLCQPTISSTIAVLTD